MKKGIIVLATLLIIPFLGFNQTIDNLDYISSFKNGLAAIKKENQWAFINREGDIVINYRNDLVITRFKEGNYPVFNNHRCLIKEEINGISFFGYIDTSGKVIIEPQFLNATNYVDNEATVLKMVKEQAGNNNVLGKNVVYYRYFEVVIDHRGNIIHYLTTKGINTALDTKFLSKPPKIRSKRLSDNLYAFMNDNNKWTVKNIK